MRAGEHVLGNVNVVKVFSCVVCPFSKSHRNLLSKFVMWGLILRCKSSHALVNCQTSLKKPVKLCHKLHHPNYVDMHLLHSVWYLSHHHASSTCFQSSSESSNADHAIRLTIWPFVQMVVMGPKSSPADLINILIGCQDTSVHCRCTATCINEPYLSKHMGVIKHVVLVPHQTLLGRGILRGLLNLHWIWSLLKYLIHWLEHWIWHNEIMI